MAMPANAPTEIDFSQTVFLTADDKPFFRDMLHTAVMRHGAKDVKHAGSVEVAMDLMNRLGQQIGCVVCDWNMAPLGGLELLRMIRCKTLPKTAPRTPVIILTPKADAGAVRAAMALDVNGFALAPLSVEKLVKTIANGLSREWELQSASAYAAVPRVEPPAAIPEKTIQGAKVGVLMPGKAKESTAPAAASTKPFPRRAAELINVNMCSLNKVRPGDILARDIHDRSGQLLLKSGTELKASLIDRLNDVAGGQGDSYHVWVGERETRTA
jgi:DNA-binding NarL/FixJ family response regulator